MLKVFICQGTVCHVMGGSDLPLVADLLPDRIRTQVEFIETPCLGICNKEDNTKPPYVKLNEKVLDEVSVTKLFEAITAEFN